MRWVLLSDVVAIVKSKEAHSRSFVPQTPYNSELLMLEMMAQTGGLLVGAESDFKEDLIFAKVEKAEFYKPYQAGDKIDIKATSENLRPEGAWLDGQIESQKGKIAESRFLLMNVGHLVEGQKEPITFHDAFMGLYQVRKKVQ